MNFRLIALLLILSSFRINAQYFPNYNTTFEKLVSSSDITLNTVNCMLKDNSGFLWIGTASGLQRFDSKRLVNFNPKLTNKKELSNLWIYDLYQDVNHTIWIATDFGLYSYDPNKEVFSSPYDMLVNKRVQVFDIEFESDSTFWLGTARGLRHFNIYKGVIESYKHEPYQPNSLSDPSVISILNENDKLWLATDYGLDVFNKKNKSFNHHLVKSETGFEQKDNSFTSIVKDDNGDILIGTNHNGLAIFNPQTSSFKIFNTKNSALSHNEIRQIQIGPSGTVWIATNGGGLCTYDKTSGIKIHSQHSADRPEGLSSNNIYSVLEDNYGTIWLGTFSGGINYNTTRSNSFKMIKHIPFEQNSICNNNVRSVYLDKKNDLWIGTFGGLSYYNHKNKKYTSYIHDKDDNTSISFNTITYIYEDSKERVWIGTYSGGLNLLDKKTGNFKHLKCESNNINSLSSNNIYDIVEDKNGALWLATTNGLTKYLPEQNEFKQIGENLRVRDICVLDNDNFLLAINNGIAFLNITTNNLRFYYIDIKKFDPYIVSSIYMTDENTAWLGTQGSGLGKFNIKEKTFTSITESDGLVDNNVSCIIPYQDNQLWISTNNGLSVFNHVTNEFINFELAEGIPTSGFNTKAGVTLPDGKIALGGTQGLVLFTPEEVLNKVNQSNLVFTDLKIDNISISANADNSPLKYNINTVNDIELSYRQNDFSIEFVDINYISKGSNHYIYTLENYSDKWMDIDYHDKVAFTNIKPGKYTFKVRTASSNKVKSLNITIKRPFWMQWYFFIFIGLIAITLIILYNKYAIISINQKNKMHLEKVEFESQTELNKMRTRFFTYISHELRTPLTLIIDPLRKALRKINEPEINRASLENDLIFINKSTNRLLLLVDQIIDFRKIENDALKLQVSSISINRIVKDVFMAFEEMAAQRNINYTLEQNKELKGWVDQDKIEKIMYNLLNNAFKFTKDKGEITVMLDACEKETEIYLSVKDTGKGIADDKKDKIFELFFQDLSVKRNLEGSFGLGLSYVNRLVKLHHGNIEVRSKENHGSTFKVTLPIETNSYTQNERCYIIENPETNSEKVHSKRRELLKSTPDKALAKKEYSKRTPKIVIVEDEEQLRNYFEISISPQYKTYTASNGEEGLEIIKRIKPDLIISDNMMPGISGIELCELIKKETTLDNIPFILISAWSSDDKKAEGLQVGAIDYISKPLDMDLLLMKIDSILYDRKKLKDDSKSTLDIAPEEPEFETDDMKFMRDIANIIEEHIDNPDFNSIVFEEQLGLSHSALYRKLKRITGLSSNEFIRDYRMKRAKQIIDKDKDIRVADVSFRVGYEDSKYFSLLFKKQFGITPSQYKKQQD